MTWGIDKVEQNRMRLQLALPPIEEKKKKNNAKTVKWLMRKVMASAKQLKSRPLGVLNYCNHLIKAGAGTGKTWTTKQVSGCGVDISLV